MTPYLTNIRTCLSGPQTSWSCPHSRIILEATAPFLHRNWTEKGKIFLVLPGVTLNMPLGTIKVNDGQVSTITVSADNRGAPKIVINTVLPTDYQIKEMPGLPFRMAVDIDRSPLIPLFSPHHFLLDPANDSPNTAAVSPTGLPEHIPTLDIARRLGQLLFQVRAKTNMTRIDNSVIPVSHRLRSARELGSTLFIAIGTRVQKRNPSSGFQLKYYYGSPESRSLASLVQQELERKISIPCLGLNPTNITLLRDNPAQAAVLVEVACISHRLDEGLLRDIDFRQAAAQGLFNGIREFFLNSH